MKDIAGKVAVITGGASPNGIGFATGALLARHGARVVLADVDEAGVAERAVELCQAGGDVIGLPVDVADDASVRELAAAVHDRHERVHVAFLNAGIAGGGTLLDGDLNSWRHTIGVNFLGVLHGIKAFVPGMIEHGEHAHVIATGSVAGVTGVMYTNPSYAVTKQAVWGLMECLHGQLRDAEADIQVTLLLPPLARTNLGGSPQTMEMAGRMLEAAGVPGEVADPAEVAAIVLDSLRDDTFWAHLTHEQDRRLTNERFTAVIDWENRMAETRVAAIVNRSAPDPYLWGALRT